MKRFWQDVAVDDEGGIALDGRPVRTPGRVPLRVPTPALAEAIAAEWRAVEGEIDPRAMPLTGLANAAIDRVAPDAAAFAAGIARYGESDLLCYRADPSSPLADRQAAAWDPLLDWARGRYDVHFVVVAGIMPQPQPAATTARLMAAVAAFGPYFLAPLSVIVSVTGSLVIGLSLLERAATPDAAWIAAHVDEDWQAELWGSDPLAEEARAGRRREFDAANAFLTALHTGAAS